jgi:hypothetical protein
MLTGRLQHVDLLYAAKSFLRFYRGLVSLVVHGDASLTADAIDRIRRHLPGVTVFEKRERDALIDPALRRRGLEKCILFRQVNPFATKIVDAPLLSSARRICLLDTDCLSFRALDALADAVAHPDMKWIFARDSQEFPYCVTQEEAVRFFGFPIAPHICAGFCVVDPRELDLGEIEGWLRLEGYPLRSHFAEQTIVAALATRGGVTFLPDSEFNTGRTKKESECSLIHYCGHYLSETRIAMRRDGQSLLVQSLKRQRV